MTTEEDAQSPSHDYESAHDELRDEVLHGLTQRPKRWPCRFLYDSAGSQLFEKICELDEYYPTRTETAILDRNIEEIVTLCGRRCLLLELGSGSSTKTRILLNRLRDAVAYVPIDISRQQLQYQVSVLNREYPKLAILPVYADYTRPLRMPDAVQGFDRKIVFFPGSTVGNFEPDEAVTFLRRMATLCGPRGSMIIGVDLKKNRDVLERAYNDSQGVTAAFNLNLLRRANRELGADFNLEHFRHRAIYRERIGCVEMRLVSTTRQVVHVNGTVAAFEQGEPLITEHSYKYSLEEFGEMAERAGFGVRRVWTDPRGWFSVHFLDPQPNGG
jgi:dimethylhistidine N-methyltransferase